MITEINTQVKDNIDSVMNQVDNLSEYVDTAVNELVKKYCSELDNYMKDIDNYLIKSNGKTLLNEDLEEFALNLPAILYFTGEAQENLGIKEDICKAIKTEVYNKAREKSSGTVADKDMAATLASQAETVTQMIYGKAYKKIKLRTEAAYEMLNSIKKVITRRIAETELSNTKYSNMERVK